MHRFLCNCGYQKAQKANITNIYTFCQEVQYLLFLIYLLNVLFKPCAILTSHYNKQIKQCSQNKCDPVQHNERCTPNLRFRDFHTTGKNISSASKWYKNYFHMLLKSKVMTRERQQGNAWSRKVLNEKNGSEV